MKIIISESQYKFIFETAGVPEGIIDASKKLYDTIFNIYKINGDLTNFSKQKKIKLVIKDIDIEKIHVTFDFIVTDDIEKPIELAFMSVLGHLSKSSDINRLNRVFSDTLDLKIGLAINASANKKDVIDFFEKNKIHITSVLAHELKHKFDNIKYPTIKTKNLSRYETLSGSLYFNVKPMDEFFHYLYYLESTESKVRPSEIATRMKLKNISKEDFYNFITNDVTFKMLNNIKNITYENFVSDLKNHITDINKFFDFNSIKYKNLTIDEQVDFFIKITYITFSNTFFDKIKDKTTTPMDMIFGIDLQKSKFLEKMWLSVVKYKDKEKDFFKKEISNMGEKIKNIMKRISKIYSLLEDENKNSIHEWHLYKKSQKKPKIYTEYKK